jgi:hypothetical protein
MRSRIGVTAAAAALSVLLSAAGHAIAAGHPVPPTAVPSLVALTGVAFALAMSGLRLPVLLPGLAAIQVAVHSGLDTLSPAPVVQQHVHHVYHGAEPVPAATVSSGQPGWSMPAMHVAALLVSLLLLHRAQQWYERIGTAVARVIPVLPEAPRLRLGVPEPVAGDVRPAPFAQRWLPADVRRRGPPHTAAHPVPS